MKDGIADKFTFRFVAKVAYARYRITLPRGCEAVYEPVGFEETDDNYTFGLMGEDSEGRLQYVFEGVDIPPYHEVGVRLELKKGGARR